jgi:hypothetical protein
MHLHPPHPTLDLEQQDPVAGAAGLGNPRIVGLGERRHRPGRAPRPAWIGEEGGAPRAAALGEPRHRPGRALLGLEWGGGGELRAAGLGELHRCEPPPRAPPWHLCPATVEEEGGTRERDSSETGERRKRKTGADLSGSNS